MLLLVLYWFCGPSQEEKSDSQADGARWLMFTPFMANILQNRLAAPMLSSALGLVLLSGCKA